MNLDEAFYTKVTAALTATIGTRCYPKFVPQTGDYPCVVYETNVEQRGRSFAGTNGLNRAIITVGCYSTTDALAHTLGAAFVTAIKNQSRTTWGTVKIARAHVEDDLDELDQIVGNDGLLKFGVIYSVAVWYVE